MAQVKKNTMLGCRQGGNSPDFPADDGLAAIWPSTSRKTCLSWREPNWRESRGPERIRRALENMVCKEILNKLGLFSLKQRRGRRC